MSEILNFIIDFTKMLIKAFAPYWYVCVIVVAVIILLAIIRNRK